MDVDELGVPVCNHMTRDPVEGIDFCGEGAVQWWVNRVDFCSMYAARCAIHERDDVDRLDNWVSLSRQEVLEKLLAEQVLET